MSEDLRTFREAFKDASDEADRLRHVLAWYADPSSWILQPHPDHGLPSNLGTATSDRGLRARKALGMAERMTGPGCEEHRGEPVEGCELCMSLRGGVYTAIDELVAHAVAAGCPPPESSQGDGA